MRAIDLFAGVGGMSQGFIKAGFEINLAVEIDAEIAQTYSKNHLQTTVYKDAIQNLEVEKLVEKYGTPDIIIGGPPCQGFSQKGKRLHLEDERNYLFSHFVKFVESFRPPYFLMENVPNIVTASNGYFKDEIVSRFNKLGYEVDVKILSAAEFGIPQLRKRAFFLGKLNRQKIFLPEKNDKKTTVKDAIYDLPFINSGEGEIFYPYLKETTSFYQKSMRKNSEGIYNHQATKHSKLALERLSLIPKGRGREVLPKEHLTKSIYSGTWTRLKEDGLAPTLTTRFDTPSSGMFTHPVLNRCLTIREGARIQSFPDAFIFYGSKSSQLKQVGNAVPPLLAFEIAKIIKKDLTKL